MFIYPFGPAGDLVRKNVEIQLSLFKTLSERVFNTSLQLGELNRQAGHRLMEESAADLQKILRIQSLADAQSFVGEQSQVSVEKMRGYWQNVQHIAAENWIGAQQVSATEMAGESTEDDQTRQEGELKKSSVEHHPGQHEVDVHPSPLVEKLVASVAVDTDKSGARTR